MRPRGVVPLILQMGRDSTDFYKGQTTWLVISFLYFSVMYISEMPWFHRKDDFQCEGNISEACVTVCYNEHFSTPVIGMWNCIGLIIYSIFFMMEFSVFQTLCQNLDYPQQSSGDEPPNSLTYNANNGKEMISNLSNEKFLLIVFLIYYLVQMTLQGIFLFILWYYHRPMIKEGIWCHTAVCQGPYFCVFMETQEKLVSITLLTLLSVIIIVFCIIFFLYTTSLYTITNVVLVDIQAHFQQQS